MWFESFLELDLYHHRARGERLITLVEADLHA